MLPLWPLDSDEKYHDYSIYFANSQIIQVERNFFVIGREVVGMIFLVKNLGTNSWEIYILIHVGHDGFEYMVTET